MVLFTLWINIKTEETGGTVRPVLPSGFI